MKKNLVNQHAFRLVRELFRYDENNGVTKVWQDPIPNEEIDVRDHVREIRLEILFEHKSSTWVINQIDRKLNDVVYHNS